MKETKNTRSEIQKGSILDGNTIKAVEYDFSFQIPDSWLRWFNENETYPNLHLSPTELAAIKNAEGEWDKEFATILNEVLPFEQCVAHVGGEGWGANSLSYGDLQVRAYILSDALDEIKNRALSKGASAASKFASTPCNARVDQIREWQQVLLEYLMMYSNYGAKAFVALRMKRFGNRTVCFAFMYTDNTDRSANIEFILNTSSFH